MKPSFRLFVRKGVLRIRRKNWFRAGFFLFLGGLVCFSVIGDRGLWKSFHLWRESRAIDAEIATLTQEVKGLRAEVKRFRHSRRALEQYAREELQLAGDDEIQYIFK